ncbi:MAG TPA: acetyl-CoA carboxylase biotin carboxylase subunit, partial [Terriglobales bacterium]|nr:acetyl-CoA carboxylase biotin carboxylase subunit [Terriglobales bacterium]
LEVNTRLQVEHPVTELVTGLDLPILQIHIAAGERLPFTQADIAPRGHAIECRVYAEDPEQNFMPSPGTILRLRPPAGPGVREDSGVYEGWTVPLEYDPLLSKLIVWGEDRAQAVVRMRRALEEYQLAGLRHNLEFFRRVLADPEFLAGQTDTGYVARLLARTAPANPRDSAWEEAAVAAAAVASQASVPAPAAVADSASHWQWAARWAALQGGESSR